MSQVKSMSEIETQWQGFDRPSDGTVYIHHKGGRYTVVSTGFFEETLKPCVVYRAEKDDTVWVRSAENFFEEVVRGEKKLPRFRQAAS